MRLPVVDVAASVVIDKKGRILLAERTARQLSAGWWELPGGKIDPGETAVAAAARELREEIGIEALSLRPWIGYTHDFATRRIRLQFFRVDAWRGTPHGHEGQRLAWIDPAAPAMPLLPSNRRVLEALALPRMMAATTPGVDPAATLREAAAALALGTRLILISGHAMAPDQRVALARRVGELARRFGAQVLIEGSALEAHRSGSAGLLAGARELRRSISRPLVPLWGARCRDAADLARAAALGADFAVIAPVLASLDATPPLGWLAFTSLAEHAPFPVYAQGGITPSMLGRAGIAGIAVDLADLKAAAASAA